MLITRIDPFTSKENTINIPVTRDQILAWKNGELIQNAMPNLTSSQREFIMTGIVDETWDEIFNEF